MVHTYVCIPDRFIYFLFQHPARAIHIDQYQQRAKIVVRNFSAPFWQLCVCIPAIATFVIAECEWNNGWSLHLHDLGVTSNGMLVQYVWWVLPCHLCALWCSAWLWCPVLSILREGRHLFWLADLTWRSHPAKLFRLCWGVTLTSGLTILVCSRSFVACCWFFTSTRTSPVCWASASYFFRIFLSRYFVAKNTYSETLRRAASSDSMTRKRE